MAETATTQTVERPKKKALVLEDSCTGCEYCVNWCPVPDCLWMEARSAAPDEPPIVKINVDTCIGCTLCEQYCPYDAIHVYKLSPQEIENWMPFQGVIPIES